MSIKKAVWLRVLAAVGSMILCCVLVNVALSYMRSAQQTNNHANDLLKQAIQAEVAHYKWSAALGSTVYEGVEFTGSTADNECALGQWLYGELEYSDDTILALRDKMLPIHKSLHESAAYVIDMLYVNPQEAENYYTTEIENTINTLIGYLDELVVHCEGLSTDKQNDVNNAIIITVAVATVCSIFALICLAWLVRYVMREVINPIIKMTKASEVLYEGHLDLSFDYASQNELGRLAQVLQTSMSRINGYVVDINRILAHMANGDLTAEPSEPYIGDFASIEQSIRKLMNQLNMVLGGFNRASEQVSNSAEQLSSGAQALASGATEQATSVDQLRSLLEDMKKTAEGNAQTAEKIQDKMNSTMQQMRENDTYVQNLVDAMNDMTEATKQIESIIKAVETITFQTNILALNAAVEAARAGNAGKGFAVVADEVRNLAIQSENAVKSVNELIGNTVHAVERGNETVNNVFKSVQQAITLVTESTDEIKNITEAVKEEASSIGCAASYIHEISTVVNTTAASSEESAAVSEELLAQANNMKHDAKFFKIKNR